MENTYTNFLLTLVLLLFCSMVSLWYIIKNPRKVFSSSIVPINWPIVGMLPGVVLNHQRFVHWCWQLLLRFPGSTFLVKGPWFSSMEILLTSSSINVQHILCKHHLDFHKGSRFNEIFDYLGDGIFNVDDDLWRYQRKIAHSAFTSTRFQCFMVSCLKEKIEHGLVPILDRSWRQNDVIDLQEIFGRLTSDITSLMLTGYDPNSLRYDLPNSLFCDSAHEGEVVLLMRHLLPESVWKLQRWLGVGGEGKLKRLMNKVDDFFFDFLPKKRKQVEKKKKNINESDAQGADLFSLYIEEDYGRPEHGFKSTDRFLRDTFGTFMLAGQDTVSSALSWFFWLLSQNPRVEAKIKEEMIAENANITTILFQRDELVKMKLVYLQASINEALRLYPPVPTNHKAACREETLPTGHKVGPQTMILMCAYAMGRMEELWGKDCLEFKPERWITEEGGIRYEPAHKFLAFNAGPRICLGKDISLIQMKAVICTLLARNFRFKVVQGHRVEPKFSVILHMKHGLKVMVVKD